MNNNNEAIWENILVNNPQFEKWWEILPIQTGGQDEDVVLTHSLVNTCVRFNCEQHTIECSFKSVDKTFAQAQNEITQMFVKLHQKMLELLSEKDKIRITFFQEDFDRGIGYPFMDKRQLRSINLQEKFESVIQSYKTINMNSNNSLTANIIIAHLPSGSGNKKRGHSYQSQQEYFDDNLNYITIENDDNYCLIRAVIVAIANYENDPNLNKLLKYPSTLLYNKVVQVAKKCQIDDKPCGIQEIKKLEVYFKEYQITLLNSDSKFDNKPIYSGLKNSKFLYIYHTGTHFNVI